MLHCPKQKPVCFLSQFLSHNDFLRCLCAPRRSPLPLCNLCFYLWALHVRPLQSRGRSQNAQCFGERVLLQPPLLLLCSHFPEKHLPGLAGLPQLPGRQWEPKEVRGGTLLTPLILTETHQPGTWQRGFHGWDWATEMHSLTLGGAVGCQILFNTQLYCTVLSVLFFLSNFFMHNQKPLGFPTTTLQAGPPSSCYSKTKGDAENRFLYCWHARLFAQCTAAAI